MGCGGEGRFLFCAWDASKFCFFRFDESRVKKLDFLVCLPMGLREIKHSCVGGLLGVGLQLYSNSLQKLPALRRELLIWGG